MPPRASDLSKMYLPNRRGKTSVISGFRAGHRRTFSPPAEGALRPSSTASPWLRKPAWSGYSRAPARRLLADLDVVADDLRAKARHDLGRRLRAAAPRPRADPLDGGPAR